jgi:putative acetyltransferase
MKATYRRAARADAGRLFELRRQSIVALASRGMPAADAQAWSALLTLRGMERKIRELEVWVAEASGMVVGWGAIHGDRLEGLYTDPDWAGRGIGTALLLRLEALMRARDIAAVSADASANAEPFYRRHGYEPAGLRAPNGAQPIIKRLR